MLVVSEGRVTADVVPRVSDLAGEMNLGAINAERLAPLIGSELQLGPKVSIADASARHVVESGWAIEWEDDPKLHELANAMDELSHFLAGHGEPFCADPLDQTDIHPGRLQMRAGH